MSTKDRLIERIAALSTPRDYEAEKLSDGMVDSLPPEGNTHTFGISMKLNGQ